MTGRADAVTDPSYSVDGAPVVDTSRRRTDLLVAGALPLELTRVHRPGAPGGLFGPGWCSLLDERLELDDGEVRLVRADGSVLTYADPVVGRPELPVDGGADAWPLVVGVTGSYVVTDPRTQRRHHFDRAHAPVVPLEAVTDERGHRFSLVRDPDGRLLELRHTGGVRVLVATVDGRVTGLRVAPAGSGRPDERWPGGEVGQEVAGYAYDDRGRLVGLTTPSGPGAQRWTWGDDDRPVSWTDRTGRVVALDEGDPAPAGDADPPRLADPGPASWERSPDGREAVLTDATGARTELSLDRAGRPVRAVGPDGATWRWTYDLCGRLTSATDPEHATTRLNRSAEGLLDSVVLPSGATTRWDRDAEGRTVELIDPDGGSTRVEADPTVPAAVGVAVGVAADLGGATEADVAAEHDAVGRVLARTHPAGLVEQWNLDSAGRPVGLALTLDGETRRLVLARDACGRETSRVLPGGPVLAQEWDPDGWLVAQTLSRPDADAARSRLESRLAGLGATGPTVPAAPPQVLLDRRFVRSAAGRVTRVEGREAEPARAPAPEDRLTWVLHEGRPVAAVAPGLRVLSVLEGHDGRAEALLDPDGRVLGLPDDLSVGAATQQRPQQQGQGGEADPAEGPPHGFTAYAGHGVGGLAGQLHTRLGLGSLHLGGSRHGGPGA